jgi:NADH-ubiquinone oxidoreductase chain 4
LEVIHFSIKLFFLFVWCVVFYWVDFSVVYFLLVVGVGVTSLVLGGFSRRFYFDYFSMLFILLSLVVMVVCLLSFFYAGGFLYNSLYSLSFFVTMTFLVVVRFLTVSFLVFYVLLEFIFLIMFYFLMVYGSNIDRKISAYYMFFFTMFSSLPLLVFMIFSSETSKVSGIHGFVLWSSYWGVFVMLMFFVKVPVFGLHMWLPKAHVEAPLLGSIVLSGSLLKIGFYGILRFIKFSKLFLNGLSRYFITLGWVRAFVVSLICFRQLDIKSLVAYSSVVHIGIAFSGIFSLSAAGVEGSVYECISHGLRSPLIFYGTYVLYNSLNSRRLVLSKGLNISSPLFVYIIFFVLVSSLGVPPLLSFYSEFLLNCGVLSFSQDFFLLTVFFLFRCGVYLFYFFIYFFHGGFRGLEMKFVFDSDFNSVFFLLLFLFFSPFLFICLI